MNYISFFLVIASSTLLVGWWLLSDYLTYVEPRAHRTQRNIGFILLSISVFSLAVLAGIVTN